MLFQITWLVILCTMAFSLWMAFYLFARGFPNWVTLRAVIVLLSLSGFFFSTFNHLFFAVNGNGALRAVLLVIGFAAWFSVTFQLLPSLGRRKLRWLEFSIYSLATLTTVQLSMMKSTLGRDNNGLNIDQMSGGIPVALIVYDVTISIAILMNLIVGLRSSVTREGRFFLLASIFPIGSVVYTGIAIIGGLVLPRLVSDILIFIGILLLGLSVAYYQSLVERRTTLQDFPVTSLTVLLLVGIYVFIARWLGLPAERMAWVVAFAVIAHSSYDLVREFLERLRTRNESKLRKQLRRLEADASNYEIFQFHLDTGLSLLIQALKASCGFIALKQGDRFIVFASQHHFTAGSEFPLGELASEDVSRTQVVPGIEWLAPAFEGQNQIAVIALGKPATRLDYSAGDLDLLSEVADQIGTIVSLANLAPKRDEQIMRLVTESHDDHLELTQVAREMAESMSINPDMDFVRIVEFGLRNINDFIILGQSPLAEWARVSGESHVERGRQLQQRLIAAMESLRPSDTRPGEPLPRVWYNYVVLHDAYVEGVSNREILARLFISAGTFHRTRRNALRGFARMLMEEKFGQVNRSL